jgi:hypothetical protein
MRTSIKSLLASFVIAILQQGNRSPIRSASPEPEPSLTVASTCGADPNAWQHGYQHRSSTSPVPWHQQAVNQPQQHQQQEAQGGSRGENSGRNGSSRSIARRMHSMAQVLPPVDIGPLRPTAARPPSSSWLAEDTGCGFHSVQDTLPCSGMGQCHGPCAWTRMQRARIAAQTDSGAHDSQRAVTSTLWSQAVMTVLQDLPLMHAMPLPLVL